MKTIAVSMQKGGVGKTTLAYHLAFGLAKQNESVLLVDLDPQANLSATVGITSCDAMRIFDPQPTLQWKYVCNGNDGKIGIIGAGQELMKVSGNSSLSIYTKLRRALQSGGNGSWNYVIIDCPPNLGVLTINALVASDFVLVPVLPSYYCMTGLKSLIESIEDVKSSNINPSLKLLAIVMNQTTATNVAREAEEVLSKEFSNVFLPSRIPRSIKVEEALQARKPVWEYARESRCAMEFSNVISEIYTRLKTETF